MERKAVLTFGRMNPPTIGHSKVIQKVKDIAKEQGADHHIFLSRTQDKKKNPLSHEEKSGFIKQMHPGTNIPDHEEVKTPIQALIHLHKQGYKHATLVVGSDRVDAMKELVHKYNGHPDHYNFKSLHVVSAGERDPDAEGVEGASGSSQREHAKNKDLESFKKGVSDKKIAEPMYRAVRKGLQVEGMKAIFVVGAPGSGKDVIIKTCLEEYNLLEINSDKLHKAILNQINLQELRGNPSLIVNGNADDYDQIALTKVVLETIGYDSAMVYVYTTDNASKLRCGTRKSKNTESIMESRRSAKYNKSVSNMKIFSELFEDFHLFDNSRDFNICEEVEQKEIASWFVELKGNLESFLLEKKIRTQEKVLEYGTDESVKKYKQMTPGETHVSEKLNSRAKFKQRMEEFQTKTNKTFSEARRSYRNSEGGNTRTSGTKKAKKEGGTKDSEGERSGIRQTSPLNQYFNANLGAVPSGGIGLTAYKTESTIKEAVDWHLENKVSFTENVFRPGSERFFELMVEARKLYESGKYKPSDEYEQDLLQSDIGEFAIYEGVSVALDFPYTEDLLVEKENVKSKTDGKRIGKPFRQDSGGAVYVRTSSGDIKKVVFSNSGMTKKFNDPARVKSFVARHNCLGNKDKTSPAYWACRWPRYFSNSGKKWW